MGQTAPLTVRLSNLCQSSPDRSDDRLRNDHSASRRANLRWSLLPRSFKRPRFGISSLPSHDRQAEPGWHQLQRRCSPSFPAGRHRIGLCRRLPPGRRNYSLLAGAKPHCAGLLTKQSRRVCPCGRCGTRSAAHQIDTVTKAPCLLEIQSARRRVHFALQIFDGVGHHHP